MAGANLTTRRIGIFEFPYHGLHEYRITERTVRQRGVTVQSVWKLNQGVSVGGQTILGLKYPSDELAALYGLRWDAEINLRSLKTLMQMDVLRSQSPEMVKKEIWAHLLAYNLIRTVIAQAAAKHGLHPRNISFKRAMRSVEQFRSTLASAKESELASLCETLLDVIASHRIGKRPGRTEPRQVKRRPKPYKRMTTPRDHARNHPEYER